MNTCVCWRMLTYADVCCRQSQTGPPGYCMWGWTPMGLVPPLLRYKKKRRKKMLKRLHADVYTCLECLHYRRLRAFWAPIILACRLIHCCGSICQASLSLNLSSASVYTAAVANPKPYASSIPMRTHIFKHIYMYRDRERERERERERLYVG